jgi:hypothetical protein
MLFEEPNSHVLDDFLGLSSLLNFFVADSFVAIETSVTKSNIAIE